MARLRMDDKEYDLPDSETWTTGELSEAEHALGASFGGDSQGDAMAISFYIAVRRVDKDINHVMLADKVKQIPMSGLLMDEEEETEASPLETPFGPALPPTSGTSNSDSTESPFVSRT